MQDQIPDEVIAEAKARDGRFATIEMAAAVAQELRDSHAVRVFLAAMRSDAEDALFAFAEVNPADPTQVMPLQVRVRSYTFLKQTIDRLMQSASVAEQQLTAASENY